MRSSTFSMTNLRFKIGLMVMLIACVSSWVWSSARSNASRRNRTDSPQLGQKVSEFMGPLPDPIRFTETAEVDRQQVLRQLDRHARHKSSGYYSVLVDEGAPPELRKRIQAEYNRLQALASEHQESGLTKELDLSDAVSVQIDREGRLSDDLALNLGLMVNYGRWDEFNQNHIGVLRRQMNDHTIPERQRPTPEDIRQAEERALVPLF